MASDDQPSRDAPSSGGSATSGSSTTAEVFARALELEGVERVYGVPGEEVEDLLFAIRDADVEFVPTRHEQGAAFMADVHGRVTGDAGVCLSTLGPGATNLLTGVADAQLDRSPLVAVTGQAERGRLHRESHQAIDVVETFRPVTKWNATVAHPTVVGEVARKAFKAAEGEKPGATHVGLPADVAGEDSSATSMEPRGDVPGPEPSQTALDDAADLVRTAERPIVLAGNGVIRTGAARHLRGLVANVEVPVVTTYMGKGAIPDDDRRSLMTLTSGEGAAGEALAAADLVIAVGYDVAEHDPGDWHARDGAPIVHVDSWPAEVHAAYDPVVEVVGDVERATRALVDRVVDGASVHADWYTEYRSGVEEHRADQPADAGESTAPFEVGEVLGALRAAMAPEDVLLADVGEHKLAVAESYPAHEPGTVVLSNGFASMGISVPGAVAADLALDANVAAVVGDGGFLMNAAELETATRVGAGPTVVVLEDEDYRMISAQQEDHRGEHVGTEFGNPDLVAFAESFGVEAHRPETASELRDALSTVAADQPTLVAVPLT